MRLNRFFLIITFLACFTGMLIAQSEPVQYAVIVGVADYPGDDSDLTYTYHDAMGINDALLKDPAWKAENITLLINDAATSANIQSGIEDMATKATEVDSCLFFFAGHGTPGLDLEPVDEADGQDEYMCAYDQDICDDDFSDWIESISCKQINIFIDCCFSGGQIKNNSDKKVRSIGKRRTKTVKNDSFIDDLFPRKTDLNSPNVVALTACDDDEVSYESSLIKHGYFTYYLLYTTKYAFFDLNQNGMLSVEESFALVSQNLSVEMSSLGQNPQIYDGNTEVENEYIIVGNQLQSDLIIESVTGVAEAYTAGDIMSYIVTVRNQGAGPAEGTMLAVYAGNETNPHMKYLDYYNVPALDAGESLSIPFTDSKAPDSIHSGTYQVWGKVDVFNSEAIELSEENNINHSSSFELTAPLSAHMNAYFTEGVVPLVSEFKSVVTGGPSSFSWDFNLDGMIDSTEQYPEYEYTQPGLYSVSFTVSDGIVSDTIVCEDLISVSPADAPEYAAEFVSTTMPENMATGEAQECIVTMKNVGQNSWPEYGEVKLGAVDDSDPLTDWCRYVPEKRVRYGESCDFTVYVNPPNPGVFLSDWQMLKEEELWFGDVCETEVTVEQSTNVQSLYWGLFQ